MQRNKKKSPAILLIEKSLAIDDAGEWLRKGHRDLHGSVALVAHYVDHFDLRMRHGRRAIFGGHDCVCRQLLGIGVMDKLVVRAMYKLVVYSETFEVEMK